ncbi:MAG: phosphodiester glycosidase family protein [Candidatus Baltobacteraceae bacterium]
MKTFSEFFVDGYNETVERFGRLRASRSRRLSLPLLGLTLACLFVLALVAGFVLRERIARRMMLGGLDAATGLALGVDSVAREGGGWVLRGVTLHSRGGAAMLAAPRAEVAVRGDVYDVTLEQPQFAFLPDRYRGDELRHAAGSATVNLRVRDGTLVAASGEVPSPALLFHDVDGTLRFGAAGLAYDVTLHLETDGGDVAFGGHSELDAAGNVVHRWSAPALPLVTAGALLPLDASLHATGGWLRDLTVVDGGSLDARARLEDASFTLGPRHAVSGLHGALHLTSAGLATPLLEGTLDGGVPLSFVGEVHDLRSRFRWLLEGSNGLRSIERLLLEIANEPNLQWAHLDTAADGIVFGQYGMSTDHGPLAVSILAIDPHEPTLHLETALAGDSIVSNGERTSAMGVRTGAVAGVNGDYFDIGRSYQPDGMVMHAGVLLRGPTDRASLIVDRDNKVTFAEFKLRGVVRAEQSTFAVTQLNNWPAGDVTVITPAFGKTLPPAAGVTFAALAPLPDGRYGVVRLEPANAPIPVTFGLAFGPLAHAKLHVGETLELQYGLDPPVDGAVAGLSGGPLLLRDGAWYEDPHAPAPAERDVRWPVVALARQSDDTLLMVAVDGRHPERSVGMTRPEFGTLLQRFGAVDAMALDSGGSVTMVSRAPGNTTVTVRNVPSDFSAERWVSDGLFVYSSAPLPALLTPRFAPTPIPEARPTP